MTRGIWKRIYSKVKKNHNIFYLGISWVWPWAKDVNCQKFVHIWWKWRNWAKIENLWSNHLISLKLSSIILNIDMFWLDLNNIKWTLYYIVFNVQVYCKQIYIIIWIWNHRENEIFKETNKEVIKPIFFRNCLFLIVMCVS